MMQIIKQTDEEKMAMYMKMPKKKIAEMLLQCNKILDTHYGAQVFSSNDVLKEGSPFKKCGEGENVCNCESPLDCGYV